MIAPDMHYQLLVFRAEVIRNRSHAELLVTVDNMIGMLRRYHDSIGKEAE